MKRSAALLLLLLASPLAAQQEEENYEELFEGEILEAEEPLFDDELVEDSKGGESSEEVSPEEAFLVSEQLEWGGSFELELSTQVEWARYTAPWERAFWQDGDPSLTTRLSGDLFFDARPERDFRVFGKVKADYRVPSDWEVEIFELFSDFQLRDRLYFRAGKQTVQWGVGYFFSPADVLSLVSIDPEDPEVQREGPVAVKTHFPFGAHNAYLFLIANDIDEPYQIAVAPRLELLLGDYELGIGAFYQTDLTPKGMMTLTGPFRDLDLFAEAMVQWGSDRTFVEFTPPPSTYSIDRRLLFSGTAGFGYRNSEWNLTLFAQYYFNGQGYKEQFSFTSTAVGAALLAGEIAATDLIDPGRHYLAASIGWSEVLDSDFSLSLFYMANFSDSSGLINPSVTWEPVKHVGLSTGIRLSYGESGDEYGRVDLDPIDPDPEAGPVAWTFSVSLGAGKF
jgi:hypothetical protein